MLIYLGKCSDYGESSRRCAKQIGQYNVLFLDVVIFQHADSLDDGIASTYSISVL